MGVKLAAASGGSIELVPTNTASAFTVTVPAKTGTMAMDGPAFSAYQSSAQTVSSSTYTLMQFQTEEFDTASAFNNTGSTVGSTPAYAFLPTVAGYYQFTANANIAAAATSVVVLFYKNGVLFKSGNYASGAYAYSANTSALIYLNGTDYVQAYILSTVGQALNANAGYTYFQAAMVRSA